MKLLNYIRLKFNLTKKEALNFLRNKKVYINNIICTSFDVLLNELDIIKIDDLEFIYKEYIYLLLNKPNGYISSLIDEVYPSIINLVPFQFYRSDLLIVGRLDVDTEGAIIITNDGQFLHHVTHPKSKIEKKYYCEYDLPIKNMDVSAGIEFSDYKTGPIKLEAINDNSCYITITDGKYHEVKRIISYLGSNITYLKRESIKDVDISNLEIGGIRELTIKEVNSLME